MRLYEDIDRSNYLLSIQKSLLSKKGGSRFPKDIEINEVLLYKDIYSMLPRSKHYFLERLENYKNTEPVQIEGNPGITIEHIFPQNPDPQWLEELGEKDYIDFKEKYLNTIANLTLSGNNGSLGNKSFKEKRDMSEKGYKDSRLFMNRYLAKLEKWDIDEIHNRYKIIYNRFVEIWQCPELDLSSDINNEEINIFEAEDPTNRKIEYITFFDDKVQVSSAIDLYKYVINYLFSNQSKTFFTTDLGERIGLTKDREILRHPILIDETGHYYFEGHLSNKDKFERIKYALSTFELLDALYIKYCD